MGRCPDGVAGERGGNGDDRRLSRGLFLLLLVVQGAAIGAAFLAIDPRRRPIVYALLIGAASLPWLWLTWGVLRGRFSLPLGGVLVGGILLRGLVQLAPPAVLSDDVYRYVWEGRAQLAGHNPFLASPQSLAGLGQGDPVWERVNNKDIPAAYPPLGQLFLRLLASTGGSVRTFRLGFACLDVLVMFLLAAWLARIGRPPALAVVHGLCPLAIVEMAAVGHNDALAIVLLVAAFWAAARPRISARVAVLTGLLLGAAISAKYLPIVLVPFFARRDLRVVVPCVATFVLSWIPFWPGLEHALHLFDGLHEYGARWRSNDSLFAAIIAATEWVMDKTQWFWPTAEPQRVAKIPLALLFAGCWLAIFRRRRDPAGAFVAICTVVFAITPTLHPWYVVWAVPFLALRPDPAPFLLAVTISFSYHVLPGWYYPVDQPEWQESAAWKLVVYVPFYLAVLHSLWRSRAAARLPSAGNVG